MIETFSCSFSINKFMIALINIGQETNDFNPLPTTLAVAIAEAAGMPLVARAAGADATVYAAAPERAS